MHRLDTDCCVWLGVYLFIRCLFSFSLYFYFLLLSLCLSPFILPFHLLILFRFFFILYCFVSFVLFADFMHPVVVFFSIVTYFHSLRSLFLHFQFIFPALSLSHCPSHNHFHQKMETIFTQKLTSRISNPNPHDSASASHIRASLHIAVSLHFPSQNSQPERDQQILRFTCKSNFT